MAFKAKSNTDMRDDAKATANLLRSISAGTILASANEKKDGWIKVSFRPPGGPVVIVGWVLEADCDPVPDGPRPPLDKLGLVLECYMAERKFNKSEAPSLVPWIISAELLIARAQFETGVTNAGPQPATPDGVGPLQVTAAEWTDFAAKGGQLVSNPDPARRDDPMFQIDAAAWRMHTDIKAISDAKLAQGVGTADAPFMPTLLDVFHAYLLNDPKAAVALIDAQASDAGKDMAIKDALGWNQAKIDGLFAKRGGVLGATSQIKVREFVAATDKALAAALQFVFDFTKANAPDELPTVPAAPNVTMVAIDPGDVAAIPPADPAAFADIATPLNQTFWPVITNDSQAMVVSYKDKNGEIVGSRGRCFFADRQGGARHHVGMDIFCKDKDVVVACGPGKIVNYYKFYKSSQGEDTFALFVAHDFVVNYGEVKGNAPAEFGWQVGDTVKAGKRIARVSTTNMIHFETYQPGTTQNSRWLASGAKPSSLLNPTVLLLKFAGGATRILPNGHRIAGIGMSGQVASDGGAATSLGSDDLLTMARTIFGEARGEIPAGRAAVAHVVMNRVRIKFRGDDTVSKVCLHAMQFSCWNAGDPNRPKIISLLPGANSVFEQCCDTAEQVMKGQLADNTGGATHYYSKTIAPPNWAAPPAQLTVEIGTHRFFKNVA